MPELLTIYRPDGKVRQATRRQYERLWKPRGWRLNKPRPPVTEPTVTEPAGESPDVKEG